MIRYIDIKEYDDVNSDDFSISIFFSHCEWKCEGCYSPFTWDKNNGEIFDESIQNKIINKFKNEKMLSNLVLIGGDPLSKLNRNEALSFAKKVKREVPRIKIWCYTGYEFDMLSDLDLSCIDYLKCGTYKKELTTKDNIQYGIKLATSNQKIIDVQKTLLLGKEVLHKIEE